MIFDDVSIHAIKSISQRTLASLWDELSRDCDFPSLEDFRPGSRMHDPKQLVVWTVEGDGATRRFRALYQGTSVTEVFNATWEGRTMDEVVPEFTRNFALDAANECADTGSAIYTVFTTTDPTSPASPLNTPAKPHPKLHEIIRTHTAITIKVEHVAVDPSRCRLPGGAD